MLTIFQEANEFPTKQTHLWTEVINIMLHVVYKVHNIHLPSVWMCDAPLKPSVLSFLTKLILLLLLKQPS